MKPMTIATIIIIWRSQVHVETERYSVTYLDRIVAIKVLYLRASGTGGAQMQSTVASMSTAIMLCI